MIEEKLNKIANKLDITIDELIDQYLRMGLYADDYYIAPKFTKEELNEMAKKEVERDIKNGIPPKKHNFDQFVGLLNK